LLQRKKLFQCFASAFINTLSLTSLHRFLQETHAGYRGKADLVDSIVAVTIIGYAPF